MENINNIKNNKYKPIIINKKSKSKKSLSKYKNDLITKKPKLSKKNININISNKTSIIFNFNGKKDDNKKGDGKNNIDDINELPFSQAIHKDKRNIFQIFFSIIIKKNNLINLFYGKEKIKTILLSEYILTLIIDFFFNTLLFTDEIVSRKYHNNGELELLTTIILSLLSNILSSIICYYLDYSKLIEERFEQIIEMKRALYYHRILDQFLTKLKIKICLFIIKEILIIIITFYYIITFCILYSFSKKNLLYNYLTSLLEQIIKTFIICIIISILRKGSLNFSNRYIYNTSKYINDKF